MTLTQAATLTRRGIIATLIVMVLSIIGITGYNFWHQYQLAQIPPAEEQPEMKFGILPKLQFPPSKVSSSNFSYTLDTVTGGLPQTPKLLKVYFIPRVGISLLAPEKSKQLAVKLGFENGPQVLSQDKYKFTNQNNGELIIDITTGNFNFTRRNSISNTEQVSPPGNEKESQTDATASGKYQPPDKEKLITDFKNYLASKDILREELATGRSDVSFGENAKDAITVSLWPTDFENFPIINATYNKSLVTAIIAPSEEEEEKRFLEVKYVFWVIDKTTFSTYPIKTAAEAFADLQAGKGFISIEPPKPQVSISSVYLAYFQSEEYSPYLQPVFVFEGPNFAAIVPAVKEE